MAKNQYLNEIVPHLADKYGAAQAETLISSALKHYDAICAIPMQVPGSSFTVNNYANIIKFEQMGNPRPDRLSNLMISDDTLSFHWTLICKKGLKCFYSVD